MSFLEYWPTARTNVKNINFIIQLRVFISFYTYNVAALFASRQQVFHRFFSTLIDVFCLISNEFLREHCWRARIIQKRTKYNPHASRISEIRTDTHKGPLGNFCSHVYTATRESRSAMQAIEAR